MSREITLLALGVLVMLVPFSGFPSFWRTVFLLVFGGLIVLIALSLKASARKRALPVSESCEG